jgi:hypothetical protein
MKRKLIIMAVALILSLAAMAHIKQAREASEAREKAAQHQGFIAGCSMAAKAILSQLIGQDPPQDFLERACQQLEEQK